MSSEGYKPLSDSELDQLRDLNLRTSSCMRLIEQAARANRLAFNVEGLLKYGYPADKILVENALAAYFAED